MKMGNIGSRVGLEPTYLAFHDSLLPLHQIRSLWSPLYPCPPVYIALCLRGQCRLLHLPPWNCVSMLTITYIHRVGSTTIQCIACRGSMVIPTSVVGVMKMGNIVTRMGLKPTSLAFRAKVLSLHHIAYLMSLQFPHPPVYVALCLRGQCRLLQYHSCE